MLVVNCCSSLLVVVKIVEKDAFNHYDNNTCVCLTIVKTETFNKRMFMLCNHIYTKKKEDESDIYISAGMIEILVKHL